MNIPTTTYARHETDHFTGQEISVLGDCACALLHNSCVRRAARMFGMPDYMLVFYVKDLKPPY
jgi:hypothetical protein